MCRKLIEIHKKIVKKQVKVYLNYEKKFQIIKNLDLKLTKNDEKLRKFIVIYKQMGKIWQKY